MVRHDAPRHCWRVSPPSGSLMLLTYRDSLFGVRFKYSYRFSLNCRISTVLRRCNFLPEEIFYSYIYWSDLKFLFASVWLIAILWLMCPSSGQFGYCPLLEKNLFIKIFSTFIHVNFWISLSLFGCEKATNLPLLWCKEATFIKDKTKKNPHAFAQINTVIWCKNSCIIQK